jgi:ADP-dependent NAD(P)H-hydrate dehydratase / NAD(P)H-hydrate epimerase
MMPVLSRADMRAFDKHAIEACRVPGVVLMENAGRGATDVLVQELLGGGAAGKRVLVVCGTGNNGGDGLVMARHLLVRGARVEVFVLGDAQRMSPDARANYEAWRGLGQGALELTTGTAPLQKALEVADVVVDALFGTGLDRPIAGLLATAIEAMNSSRAPRFAVDLPSGLDADTGRTLGVCVKAHATATFAHPKLGLLTPEGARLSGRVRVVDIGVPPSLVSRIGASARVLEAADLRAWLGHRSLATHKNQSGHVVVVAGSPGKVGAPKLVAHGAMRAGAGLATIATWPEAATAIEVQTAEVMTARIEASSVAESLDGILRGKQAVVVGPGLGLGEEARAVVRHILGSWHGPTVFDADALSLFAGQPAVFVPATSAILTPHPGELARLLGKTADDVESDRFRAARELVAATGAVVVLKGAHTIIAGPKELAISPVACPALATAGSGDTLGGIVAAFACGLPPFEAACAGVLAHALAGEAWSRAHGGADRGMLASEIADALPGVFAALV